MIKHIYIAIFILCLIGCGKESESNIPDRGQVPALVSDVANGRIEKVKERLNNGENPNVETVHKHSPVYTAITMPEHDMEGKNKEMLILLLKAGAKPDSQDEDGRTPLHISAMYQNLDMIKILLKHGADVNKADSSGETAIMFAAYTGDLDVVQFLLKHGASPNIKTPYGSTLLTAAEESKNEALISKVKEILKNE